MEAMIIGVYQDFFKARLGVAARALELEIAR